MRAVLLAAGEGKRLRHHFKRPKPLIHLLGLPLIKRNILTLRECGIKDFIIITGCYDSALRDCLGTGEKMGVNIKYLYNPDWKLGNGLSAHTFHKEFNRDEKFILMMADHIIVSDVIKDFVAAAGDIKQNEILLAADRRLEGVYDLPECTKVKAENNYAIELGKGLQEFNAVDCGLFIGTGALLDALSASIAEGGYALTDAVNRLAGLNRVKLHFIDGPWVDVDDLASYKHAEKMLLQSLIPPKDGLVSRFINRKFSLVITKFLARTGTTPNQITFFSFLVAVASAICFATANPFYGGLLAQFSSIVDGVDGEIARLKFLKSNYGGIFDSILDRYADFLIIIGMTYAWYTATGHTTALLVGSAALTGMPMSMLFKEKFQAVTERPYLPGYDGISRYLLANRDGRLFMIMLGGIFNLLPFTLVLLAAVTHLQTLIRLCNARKLA